MNCFESRQEFSAIWRTARHLSAGRNTGASEGLREVRSRVSSLRVDGAGTASESDPPPATRVSAPARQAFSLGDRPRRFASAPRETERPRRWIAMSAAAAIFVVASSAAFFSTDTPRQTFGEEISMAEPSNYEAAADPLAPEMPVTESDFAN